MVLRSLKKNFCRCGLIELATSQYNIKDYERYRYFFFTVIRDAYPSCGVNQVLDSLKSKCVYYVGEATV